jgi:hypothetical protein
MWLAKTRPPTRCGRDQDNSMPSKMLPTFYGVPSVLGNCGDEPNKVDTIKRQVLKVYYSKIKQKKNIMLLQCRHR